MRWAQESREVIVVRKTCHGEETHLAPGFYGRVMEGDGG
jgi:hypothetical protein